MPSLKPVTIIGGGLAGLALGIGLRQQGMPVTILEAGRYPRHRVCGEFVSGRGQRVLESLGLGEPLRDAGAGLASTVAFFFGKVGSPVRQVVPPALCLSRFKMDALLARLFRDAGGDLVENERWRDSKAGEGFVRASGRRLQPAESAPRWLGLKVHARNVALSADLEMHGFSCGYVGLCRLAGDEVNVCGLFLWPPADRGQKLAWREILRGPPNTILRLRLENAIFDESSFCSVAGFTLRPERASSHSECCVGDALTMIPPVTGNGMSMAFESAALALGPLAGWSRGQLHWSQARHFVAQACDNAFTKRLFWAKWLQRLMFAPLVHRLIAPAGLRSDWLWRLFFAQTR